MSTTTEMSTWRLGSTAKWLDRTTLAGGSPFRVLTLTSRGADLVHELLDGDPNRVPLHQPAVVRMLARLEAAGLLRAPTPPAADHRDVTLVIPARSHPQPLRELLQTLPADLPVIIVDDGSPEPLTPLSSSTPSVRVLRHRVARGPAAARNAGAALVTTRWVAFLDADTIPQPDWIAAIMGHVRQAAADQPTPPVVLAAPRIYPLTGSGAAAWFESRVSALDLGAAPADVGKGKAVPYVPSAAMVVDLNSFRQVGGFDETMTVGEDVDLVWRLASFGRIRYLPDVMVGHRPRSTLLAALDRRRVYGTSAADLGRRHRGALRHVDVSVWSFAPWLLGIVVHPVIGLAVAAATTAAAPWGMRSLNARHAWRFALQGHLRATGAIGRWLIRPMLPATILTVLVAPAIRRRLLGTAAAGLAYLVVLDARSARTTAHSTPGVIRLAGESLIARTMDDVAYSLGVWQGVLSQRTLEPVLPGVRDLPAMVRRLGRFRGA